MRPSDHRWRRAHSAVAATALGALALATAGCGSTPESPEDVTSIVVAHSAGVNGAAVEEIVADFRAETDIDVQTLEFSDTDYGPKMQLVQQTGRADFDVATGIPSDVFLLTDTEGVYAPIDTSGFDPDGLAGLEEADLIGENYIVNQDVTPLVAYSSEHEDSPPTSWEDYFDLKKFPGNRGLQSGGFGVPINIVIALLADGVPVDDLYPLDLDRAFAKLDTIKGSIALWDNAPKALQDITDGNTVMSFVYSPAGIGAVESGTDVQITLFDGAPISRANAAVIQNGPNGHTAGNVFLDYWSKPAVQKKYAGLTNFGIVLPSPAVYDLLSPEDLEYAPFVPGQPQGTLIDTEYLVEEDESGRSNLDMLVERWNEWRAS